MTYITIYFDRNHCKELIAGINLNKEIYEKNITGF